jgi:hypothetical protein
MIDGQRDAWYVLGVKEGLIVPADGEEQEETLEQ